MVGKHQKLSRKDQGFHQKYYALRNVGGMIKKILRISSKILRRQNRNFEEEDRNFVYQVKVVTWLTKAQEGIWKVGKDIIELSNKIENIQKQKLIGLNFLESS